MSGLADTRARRRRDWLGWAVVALCAVVRKIERVMVPVVASLMAAGFVAVVMFFSWRDGRAVDRCHDLGGQTWDSGKHCVIGVDRVVDTHDRTWG